MNRLLTIQAKDAPISAAYGRRCRIDSDLLLAADACRKEGIPFYLGHAYYMKTIHGGKTKTDSLDCRKIADQVSVDEFTLRVKSSNKRIIRHFFEVL